MTVISREILLECALEYIASKGIKHFSITAFAEHVGCSLGAIHFYFKSKGKLLLGAYEYYWTKSFKSDIASINFNEGFWQFINYYSAAEKAREQYYSATVCDGILAIEQKEWADFLEVERRLTANVLPKFIEVLNCDKKLINSLMAQNIDQEKFCLHVINSIEASLACGVEEVCTACR